MAFDFDARPRKMEDVWRAMLATARKNHFWMWVSTLGLLAVLGIIFQGGVAAALGWAGRHIWSWLQPAAALPAGVVVLLLLVFVASSFVGVFLLALAGTSSTMLALRQWVNKKAQLDELAKTTDKLAEAERALAETKKTSAEEQAGLVRDRDEWRQRAHGHFWQHHYGIERPYVHELQNASQRESYERCVRPEVEKLRPSIVRLNTPLVELLTALMAAYRARVPAWLASLIDNVKLLFYSRTYNLILEHPNPDDIRVRLLAFYERYNEVRLALGRIAVLAAVDLEGCPGYADWYAADVRFFDRLAEALNVQELSELADRVRDVNARGQRIEGTPYPAQMPQPRGT